MANTTPINSSSQLVHVLPMKICLHKHVRKAEGYTPTLECRPAKVQEELCLMSA